MKYAPPTTRSPSRQSAIEDPMVWGVTETVGPFLSMTDGMIEPLAIFAVVTAPSAIFGVVIALFAIAFVPICCIKYPVDCVGPSITALAAFLVDTVTWYALFGVIGFTIFANSNLIFVPTGTFTALVIVYVKV